METSEVTGQQRQPATGFSAVTDETPLPARIVGKASPLRAFQRVAVASQLPVTIRCPLLEKLTPATRLGCIPDSGRPIFTAREDAVAVGRERDRPDRPQVPAEEGRAKLS